MHQNTTLAIIIAIIAIIVLAMEHAMYNFNIPARITARPDPNIIYSPSDGTIIHYRNDMLKDKGQHVMHQTYSVFLDFWDNHRQYAPIAGTVIDVTRGWTKKAFTVKESRYCRVTILSDDGNITARVSSIGGFFATEPLAYVRVGDKVAQLQQIAHIIRGSQCDVEIIAKGVGWIAFSTKNIMAPFTTKMNIGKILATRELDLPKSVDVL